MIMERAIIIGKRIECIIGFIFLIPALLGVLAFLICLFTESNAGSFAALSNLSWHWTCAYQFHYFENTGVGGGMSAAPIYLGITSFVGAYLIKDGMKYFFVKLEKKTKQ
jgi:hypothetical protein